MKSSFELTQNTFHLFFSNIQKIAEIIVIPVLIIFVASFFEPAVDDSSSTIDSILYLTTLLVSSIAGIFMTIALVHSIANPALTLSEAYRRASLQFLRYFVYIVAYSALVFLGLVLFIVPGIWLAILLGSGMYYVMLKDYKAGEALQASKTLVSGRWWKVAGKTLFMILVLVLLGIPTGILIYVLGLFIPNTNFVYAFSSVLTTITTSISIIYFYLLFLDLEANPVSTKVAEEGAQAS